MVLTTIILPCNPDSGDNGGPVCGSLAWDRSGTFIRCRKCGIEATLVNPADQVLEVNVV